MDCGPPLIELVDIRKTYHVGQVDVPALKGVSLTICQGEYVALTGVSGSGKTTLMNLLGCLDRPTSGVYRLEGREVSRLSTTELARLRSDRIGFVFQSFNLLARSTSLDNVVMPTSYAAGNPSYRQVKARADELLATVGLEDRTLHEPSQLSGGQQQRVAIARALINRPLLLLADEPTGNLDSRTSQEILEMFERLNAEEGITVVLVTHNPMVAGRAQRLIHITDGLIDGDTTRDEGRELRVQRGLRLSPNPQPSTLNRGSASTARPKASRGTHQGSGTHRGWVAKRSFGRRRTRGPLTRLRLLGGTFKIAVSALRRNVLRSFLTTLGIIIGVAAVIAMMEISTGATTAIHKTISTMGANTLLVLPGTVRTGGVTMGSGTATTLTPDDAEAILRECPSVRCVAPVVHAGGNTQVVFGNRNWSPRYVVGSTPSFLQARDWTEMFLGEPFTEQDVRRGSRVCLIGQTVAGELFGDRSAVGQEVRINSEPFKVIGVLRRKGANLMGRDQDDILLTPWTTLKYRIIGGRLAASGSRRTISARPGDSNYPYHCDPPQLYPSRSAEQQANTPQPIRITNVDQILAQAVSNNRVPVAMQEIAELLAVRHAVQPGAEEDFRIRDLAEVSKALKTTIHLLSGLLLSVALISLVVGGVGIMNIMLVSVTERTREIGLRMAVGASPRDILRQFLIEGITLCLLGGFMGIVVGRGSSLLIGHLLGWPTEPSLLAALAAVTVSVTVGLTFGYYPALKASRLDPIEALRYE
jgi:macrolide transport system ATP-binding/permease protein